MVCPFCQHPDTRVIDSRSSGEGIRRRRACEECGRRFSTVEHVEFKAPQVVKSDGRREAFDRQKVLVGLRLACRKRPISADLLEQAAEEIERWVQERAEREVSSAEIGRQVLVALRGLDPVAYLRFASVYYQVNDVNAFEDLVHALNRAEEP